MSPVILITGANRGIGLAITNALAIASLDAELVLAARSKQAGEEALANSTLPNKDRIAIVELDVTNDKSIEEATAFITSRYGRLDVLINNAGIAKNPTPGANDLRQVYADIFDTNITSVAQVTHAFLPLLKSTSTPRIINVSSARASVSLQTSGKLPPTASISYSISKTALNILTLEMAKLEPDVRFYAASPGHCKTAFNDYRGMKDPMDGAKVVVELALATKGTYDAGFWQHEGGTMSQVPW